MNYYRNVIWATFGSLIALGWLIVVSLEEMPGPVVWFAFATVVFCLVVSVVRFLQLRATTKSSR